MVKLDLKYGLPFCTIMLSYKGKCMHIDNVLLDTGSGGTVFKMDVVEEIDITIEDDDIIETISSVGGSEFVYKKSIDSMILGDLELHNFKIEVGVMDYGFEINGIVGMDFFVVRIQLSLEKVCILALFYLVLTMIKWNKYLVVGQRGRMISLGHNSISLHLNYSKKGVRICA